MELHRLHSELANLDRQRECVRQRIEQLSVSDGSDGSGRHYLRQRAQQLISYLSEPAAAQAPAPSNRGESYRKGYCPMEPMELHRLHSELANLDQRECVRQRIEQLSRAQQLISYLSEPAAAQAPAPSNRGESYRKGYCPMEPMELHRLHSELANLDRQRECVRQRIEQLSVSDGSDGSGRHYLQQRAQQLISYLSEPAAAQAPAQAVAPPDSRSTLYLAGQLLEPASDVPSPAPKLSLDDNSFIDISSCHTAAVSASSRVQQLERLLAARERKPTVSDH
ncbi:hypothetical protein DIPPA_09400 [Diplonema papillatum]|nr:hypothetical protein DIPPA_09400 [Diplonema papillatum]